MTGEESAAQVALRAARLGGSADVGVVAETELATVCATLETERPDVCVIDSVQTLHASELGSAPGSVAQVREATARLGAVVELQLLSGQRLRHTMTLRATHGVTAAGCARDRPRRAGLHRAPRVRQSSRNREDLPVFPRPESMAPVRRGALRKEPV